MFGVCYTRLIRNYEVWTAHAYAHYRCYALKCNVGPLRLRIINFYENYQRLTDSITHLTAFCELNHSQCIFHSSTTRSIGGGHRDDNDAVARIEKHTSAKEQRPKQQQTNE